MANERLRALEDVEKEIAMILQCAGKKALFYLHYIYSFNNEAYAVQWHSCIQILLVCTGCFPEWHFPVNYLRYLFWFEKKSLQVISSWSSPKTNTTPAFWTDSWASSRVRSTRWRVNSALRSATSHRWTQTCTFTLSIVSPLTTYCVQ